MAEKDNSRTSKELNGVYGFFMLVIGFSTVVAGILARDGLLWMVPGLALLIVGYWSVRRADIVVEEVEDKKKEANKMEYKDIKFEQINKIRQVRDDEIEKYPSSIKTLLLLLPKEIDEKKIDQKIKELKLDFYDTSVLSVAWDELFHFILNKLMDRYNHWFFPLPY